AAAGPAAAAHPAAQARRPGALAAPAPCPANTQGIACWRRLQAAEARALAGQKSADAPRRQAGRLTLGRAPALEDTPGGPVWLYEARLPGAGHHLVSQRASPQAPQQVQGLWLLQAATGRLQPLPGPVRLSPDGRHLFALSTDGHTLSLLQRAGDGPQTRWRQQFRLESPASLQFSWQNWRRDGLAVHLHWHSTAPCPADGRTQLREGPHGWELVPEPAPQEACTAVER
ncbi:hypothetical protein, partial [Ideonella livida]